MSSFFGLAPLFSRCCRPLRFCACAVQSIGASKIGVRRLSRSCLLVVGLLASCVAPIAHHSLSKQALAALPDDYSSHFGAFILLNDAYQTLHEFEALLRAERVSHVVPVEKMWLQGTDWRSHEHMAYAIPPKESWSKIVRTLEFMRDEIIPVIGQVEVMSGFRTPTYNFAAGGAQRSQHLNFSALDVQPKADMTRSQLHKQLLQIWRQRGKPWDFGLGLYSGTRFHVDTGGYRQW